MNGLVFTLNGLAVIGIPYLFGWVFLRRLFREANLLALVPGSVVVGFAALMAIVNELRFFLEMRPAVWFAYKLLLALTLLIVLTRRRVSSLQLPAGSRAGWKLLLLGTGTLAVGFYYGIPAMSGYLNDGWWYHYPATVQIQTAQFFPLHHPFAVDGPLYYHYGPDILAACWSSLFDRSVQTGHALNIVVLAPCSFLLAFALLSRLARSYWVALGGAVFLVAGGNLRFLKFLSGGHDGHVGALQVFNSQTVQGLQQLIFTPSHALGIPMVLTLILLFRHLCLRPSWLLAAMFGLLLGTLILVAEWYFFPLLAGVTLILLGLAWQRRNARPRRWGWALLPAITALAWGGFNHTYLAGIFDHFWMPYTTLETVAVDRQVLAALQPGRGGAQAIDVAVRPPRWQVPALVPLRLNFDHFGKVASWESAASAQSTYIPIWSGRFLMEVAPVMVCGIPFGLWLAWRRRQPVDFLLVWLALSAAAPPILLDWGFRSTDFLRFFTASFCFSALFFGWLVGYLMTQPLLRWRAAGTILALSALVTPVSLGLIGLLPGTLATVTAVAETARSLSDATSPSADVTSYAPPAGVFERLATDTGNFLFPLTRGRERAIVIVPLDQLPETKYFPQWMKMATLSRLLLPTGWHWQESLYSTYYREAVTTLDAPALVSLDARWVIVSNLFQPEIPAGITVALADRTRFAPAATLHEGAYYMSVFRILP